MKPSRIILATLITWVLTGVAGMLTCGHFFKWVYALPPNIWKGEAAMMETTNMVLMYGMSLLASFMFVAVFAVLHKGIPGKSFKKGMLYGILVWLVGALAGIGTMPFYMTISTTVVIYWLIQSLAMNLINGAIVGALGKK